MLVRSLSIVSENASTLLFEIYQSYLLARDHTRQIMFLRMREELHWLHARHKIRHV
jgi:hypothetical protein